MIDFDLGRDLTIVKDTVEKFARDVLNPDQRQFEAERCMPAAIGTQARKIGLAALQLPEDMGGAGLGMVAKAVVAEELAAGDPGAAMALDPLGPALHALAECGGPGAIEQFAIPILERADGRAVLVVDLTDRLTNDRGELSGTVPWVPADGADIIVVLDRGGSSLVKEGFEFRPVKGGGLRAAGASAVELARAPVVARFDGEAAAARALARIRIHIGALLVGTARAAADISRQYATERVAFGRPIGHHQGLAFLISDMRAAVDTMRLMVRRAAWMTDRNLDVRQAAAAAFVEAVEGAMFVGPNALQIFGGPGFMQDYPVEKYMREARVLGLMAGGIDSAKADSAGDIETCPLADIGLPPGA